MSSVDIYARIIAGEEDHITKNNLYMSKTQLVEAFMLYGGVRKDERVYKLVVIDGLLSWLDVTKEFIGG